MYPVVAVKRGTIGMVRSVKLAAVCFIALLLFNVVLSAQAQTQETNRTQAPSAETPPVGSNSRARRSAYQRYIEAQRLKGEAQRTRNARLLEEAIKAYKETI